MQYFTNVLDLLEASARRSPESLAVIDARKSLSYRELVCRSKRIGTSLLARGVLGKPVVIAAEKECDTLCAMMGILYAGGHYVPVDPSVPTSRLSQILDVLDRPLVLMAAGDACSRDDLSKYENLLEISSLLESDVDEVALASARFKMLETDPAYILFTSGSTGVPKGVAISHRAILSFITTFVDVMGITAQDRLANQAPLDFDVSTKDIYSTFATGATLVFVPRELFMQPVPLMDYLKEKEVTVLIWAVAALCIPSAYHAVSPGTLPSVRLVAFSGEVMPLKHLKSWRESLPQASFVNLYGPTEITCNCLYHKLDAQRDYAGGIPLGTSFPHCGVLVIDKEGHEVTEPGIPGEIVVRGPSLALGYVGMPEKTAEVFTQNTTHHDYPDRVYHTGDLATYSQDGELFFSGREDNQIKYMGHRIELEEIDIALERIPGVTRCRCAFDEKKKRLRAFYEGEADEQDVRLYVGDRLPMHMRPAGIRKVDSMPLTKNGKVDRAKLLELYARKPKSQG